MSAPTLHSSGDRVAVSVTRPDFDADSYVGQIWEVPTGAGNPRRLTRGFRDTSPQYSPDGTLLAFLRAGPDSRPQLTMMRTDSGEPMVISDQHSGVSWFSWAPDSRSVVFTSRVAEHGRYGTVDGISASAEDPRLITAKKYRMNGLGYSTDQRSHVFVMEVPDPDAEPYIKPVGRAAESRKESDSAEYSGFPPVHQLTSGDTDYGDPVFSTNGQKVLFSGSPVAGADDMLMSVLYEAPKDGGEPSVIRTPEGIGCSRPVQSDDGALLYFLGSDLGPAGVDFVARNSALYAMPAGGGADADRLTDPESIDPDEVGDIIPLASGGVLVFNRTRGTGQLLHISADGTLDVVSSGERIITGAAAAGTTVVATYTDPATAGDVARVDGGWRPLSDFSKDLREQTRIEAPREVTFTAPDGYPVHGWLVLPPGEGPHPVLLNIHGGPYAQYGVGLFDEAQVYAQAGYAVLMCNPRGAAGYGQEHGRVIKEAMGTVDFDDVIAFLEGALDANPELDGERLGIMGGSYGGYLTAWTISQDHRFTAAIVERGFLDPPSFIGSSDIGWFFGGAYTGTDPEKVRDQNPFAHIDAVQTPTFVIHSEEDLRCPLEQAQRYYTALKLNGVQTQLLIFPGENHELSRAGTPWHRRQRFEHILRWWAHYLPTAQNAPDEPGQ
nr:S9 family peptidase [Arthrobacter roseus]